MTKSLSCAACHVVIGQNSLYATTIVYVNHAHLCLLNHYHLVIKNHTHLMTCCTAAMTAPLVLSIQRTETGPPVDTTCSHAPPSAAWNDHEKKFYCYSFCSGNVNVCRVSAVQWLGLGECLGFRGRVRVR